MSDEAQQSAAVARILDRTAARAFKLPTQEVIPVFDQAEADCLKLDSSEEMKLESKRRVAEWKMKIFCDRDGPFEIVEGLRNRLDELGHSTLENEANNRVYFASYCIRVNKLDLARSDLLCLCSKLEE